jgi:hypothetical protein
MNTFRWMPARAFKLVPALLVVLVVVAAGAAVADAGRGGDGVAVRVVRELVSLLPALGVGQVSPPLLLVGAPALVAVGSALLIRRSMR